MSHKSIILRSCFFLVALVLLCATTEGKQEAEQIGMTGELSLQPFHRVSTHLATELPAIHQQRISTSSSRQTYNANGQPFHLDEWLLLESVDNSMSIPAWEYYALKIDLPNRTLIEIPPTNTLSDLCSQAVARAPRWLRNDLIDNLVQFGSADYLTDAIAQQILSAPDPYVDEIAFTLAHLSSTLLTDTVMDWQRDLQIVVENVQSVYAADAFLDYVQINDYGTSVDDDYWSTAEYTIRTEAGDTIQIEIDKEIYYWFVVHPRISDEAPLYIDPATGGAAAPPTGKFWRDFYLNEPDSGYVSLHDMLDSCAIMYGNLFNNSSDENGAVGIVTRWIQDVMDFGSGAERPIQPVRIYRLHLGRCGEHQDITAAAARAALIPVVGATAICNDHVWDEFWDGTRWKSWEPVNNYVGDSLAYERWGKHFPALFDWRGDGFVWTVTERYHTNTTTLTIDIRQANDASVDGAKVKIISDYEYGGLRLATCGYTNSDGTVTFTIGGECDIYVNIFSFMGRYPSDPDGAVLIIEDSDTNIEYEWTYNYNEQMAIVMPDDAPPPQDSLNHFHINFAYDMLNEATQSHIFRHSDFIAETGDGTLNFFICDEANYNRFTSWMDFEAFAIADLTSSGEIDFTLPNDNTWYAVLNNFNSLSNYQRIEFQADLYIDDVFAGTDADESVPAEFALYPNYPNPFNENTMIRFSLPRTTHVRLVVYNLLGQEVRLVQYKMLDSGIHHLIFDASGLSSGIYIYRLETDDFVSAKKMALIR